VAKKRRKTRPRPAPSAAAEQPKPAPVAAPRPRRNIEEERPPAPWGSFPLVELVVLVALGMLVGAFFVGGSRSTVLLATGLALGSLAGLELSVREHFAGYRSHTVLLAGVAAVATLALLYFVFPDLLSHGAQIAVAVAVGIAAGFLLARAFRARAGRYVKLR
jgi:hypothetical protein